MSEDKKIIRVVHYALAKLGCKVDKLGFRYLSYAVMIVIKNPSALHSLCKQVYQVVADHFEVKNAMTVHSSIRNMVDEICASDNFLILNAMFGFDHFKKNDHISCGEFIGLIAIYYTLEYYKNDEFYKSGKMFQGLE